MSVGRSGLAMARGAFSQQSEARQFAEADVAAWGAIVSESTKAITHLDPLICSGYKPCSHYRVKQP
jgi:hypothetical protein